MKIQMLTIRWKITALVVSVTILLSILDLWLIPKRMADNEADELRERAHIVAKMLAEPIAVAMDLEQPSDTFPETLNAALVDPLVLWVAVYDSQGKRLASVGSVKSPVSLSLFTRLLKGQAILGKAALRSRSREKDMGSLAVALRSDRIAGRRLSSMKSMALQAAIVVVIGLVIALFVSGRMAAAIHRIREAAERIAEGNVSVRPAFRVAQDELGDMVRAFQGMNLRLSALQDSAVRVAAGDLTIGIAGDGELFVAFRTMVENLRQLALRIAESSESVASAAAGMFTSVRDHETSAAQQNTALEEIRRTVEALSESASHVVQDAQIVREISQHSLQSSQRIADQTRMVSSHSDRIGDILTLIQDIADKSDLLALNAELEGTRAGEVGLGFSLVAAEMRKLSEHVMDSVRDIRKLVADMHEASHASVVATEDGIKLAGETAVAAAKISEAANRQREGTTQVKTAVVEILEAVNLSLRSSADSTRSAESLLDLSRELKTAARTFRIESKDHVADEEHA